MTAFGQRPPQKKRRKRSVKGPDTKGDVIARILSGTSDHVVLKRLLDQINDPKQRKILLAGLFDQMDPIEKLGFLAESDIPEAWRQKYADQLADEPGTEVEQG